MHLRSSMLEGKAATLIAELCDQILSTKSAGIAEYFVEGIGKADILLGKEPEYFPYGTDKWIESFEHKGRQFTIYLAYIHAWHK